MDYKKSKNRQIRTFERSVGIQIAQHGGMEKIPAGTLRVLRDRAKALGLSLEDGVEEKEGEAPQEQAHEGTIKQGQMLFRCRSCNMEIWVPANVPLIRDGLDAAGWRPVPLSEGWYCPTHAD